MEKVLFILIVILAASCDKEVRLASIDVVPTIEAYVGYQTTLEVSHTPAEAIAPNLFHYKSSDKNVATVNDNGVVVCHQPGTCKITVATADKRFSTQCTVVVE